MTALVAIVGDIHANSTTAVCPPRVPLDDGGEYVASKAQRWIWRQWKTFWQTVAERRAEIDGPLVVILNGEVADNNSHMTTQLVTRNPADILRVAVATLQPMLELDPVIYVTRGTEAHSGASGAMDEMVANDIGAQAADDDMFSFWRLRVKIDGVRLDVAHHPPGGGGRRPWTRQNFANALAAMAFYDSCEAGIDPPHLYVRGHVHRPVDSYDSSPVRALILPSWQLTTAYGHRIGGDVLPVGGALVVCDRGQYEVSKHYYRWPVERYITA